MNRYWKLVQRSRNAEDDVARRLRSERPPASDELVLRIVESVRSRPLPRRHSRLAFAGALTVMMLGTFVSFGWLSYAAAAVSEKVAAVKDIATADKVRKVVTNSAAADQYEPKDNKAVVITQSAPPAGGVAGETSSQPEATSPENVVEVEGTLPFTGASLLGTVGLSLALIALGVMLRRAERRAS